MSNPELLGSIQNVAIVYRLKTPQAVALSKKVHAWLNKKGINTYTAPQQKLITGTTLMSQSRQWDKIQLVVVLGGDGTYLRAVRLLGGRKIPIVGFNMGSLGFLTVFTAEEVNDVLEKTLEGKMILRPRRMILTKVYRKGKLIKEDHALNDVVIERGSFSQLINLAIYSDKSLVTQLKADGLIIASPTGSTAYNLAAGGPLLDPEVGGLVVTPVAPHSLTNRPIVFPDNRKLSFKLQGADLKAHFVVDGQKMMEITPQDEVLTQKSPYDHWVVRTPGFNPFHLLREKMKFGSR
jgi:NAD+ kinase